MYFGFLSCLLCFIAIICARLHWGSHWYSSWVSIAFQVSKKIFIIYTLKSPHFFYAIEAVWKHHSPGLAMNLVCKRSTVLQHRFSSHHFSNGPELEYSKRASDAEPGSTSSSNSDLSPVNPVKCLLFGRSRTEAQGQPLLVCAKTTLCFTLPQYGICIQVIVGAASFEV